MRSVPSGFDCGGCVECAQETVDYVRAAEKAEALVSECTHDGRTEKQKSPGEKVTSTTYVSECMYGKKGPSSSSFSWPFFSPKVVVVSAFAVVIDFFE